MATRLFLLNEASAVSGTLPSGEQSSLTSTTTFSTADVEVRAMSTLTGAALATDRAVIPNPAQGSHVGFCGMWVSPELVAGTYGSASTSIILNIANNNPAASANFGQDLRCEAYFWRPSTGTKVGTYISASAALDGSTEPTLTSLFRVNAGTAIIDGPVTVQTGDVLVVEVWQVWNSSRTVTTTLQTRFGGTTVNETVNTTSSNHAAFFQTSDNLVFYYPAVGDLNVTLGAATLNATASSVISGTAAFTLGALSAAATGWVSASASAAFTLGDLTLAATGTAAFPTITGSAALTLAAATLSATGTVTWPTITGSAALTLAAATLSAGGSVNITGTGAVTLAALTLLGEASNPITGTAAFTLADLTVVGEGTVNDNLIGTAAFTLADLQLVAEGTLNITGTAAITLADLQLAAEATVLSTITGSAAITLADLQLSGQGTNTSPLPEPQDPGAGGGGWKPRRKFVPPTEEGPSIGELIGTEPIRLPEQADITHAIVYTPIVFARPPAAVQLPQAPQTPNIVVQDSEDDDLEDIARLIAALF